MCVVSRRFKVQSAGRAQQKLFLLKTHNQMESHPLGMGRVVGNVSWMEVGKEKLDAAAAALLLLPWVGRSWRESGMGGGWCRQEVGGCRQLLVLVLKERP